MLKTKTKTENKPKGKEFQIKIKKSKILRTIVETLASIIDETEFRITPKELTISAMDPSRICLLKLTISKESFDEYKCSGQIKIVVNLDDLDKILKRSSAQDSIELSFNENDQKIKIKIKRDDSSRTRSFSLALLDTDIEEIPMENLLKIEYPSKWGIDTDFLVEAIKDAEIYSEILNIKASENQGLVFSSSGQIGELNYELSLDDLIEPHIVDSSTGAYSLTFLKTILKIASITEKLEVSLKTDHPFKMIFNLLEGGELNYFLAPRVEEADFDDDEDFENFEEEEEIIDVNATLKDEEDEE